MFEKIIIRIVLVTFFTASLGPLPDASAQALIDLPAPGMMVAKSGLFEPLQLKGILVNVKNPLRFDFLVDKGDSGLQGQPLKNDITRLAKYFLTCLTVPENDLWVNLSPYEKDRIVPDNFGITIMGKDLLEQDYLLKQIMASLSYPENDLGRRFWQRVYRKSYELYGTTEIPINTFNKVWIIPQSAEVYVQGNAAFVVKSRLDVMLEADYKAFVHRQSPQSLSEKSGAYAQVFRDVILPELREEINEGKNFAVVRQVYNAMILATWYKHHLKDSLLGRMYVGRNQVKGVDVDDKQIKERIYQQYLRAYKKCVYNYIKEDYDPITQQTVPRKYASGGMNFTNLDLDGKYQEVPTTQGMGIGNDLAMATVNVTATKSNGDIVSFPDFRTVTDTHPFHVIREDPAMMSPVIAALARKIMMPVIVVVAMSVAAPSLAAQIIPNPDGKSIQVQVNSRYDQLGKILLKSGYVHMPLWGQNGAVAKVAKLVPGMPNPNLIHMGAKFNIPTRQEFERIVSNAIDPVSPQRIIVENHQAPAAAIEAPPAPHRTNPLAAAVPDASTGVSSVPVALQTVVAGSPPPPPEDLVTHAWAWWILGLSGIIVPKKFLGFSRKGKYKEPKQGTKGNLSKTSQRPVAIMPVDMLASDGSTSLEVALPPPPASPGETQILAQDLANMQKIAQGEITLPPVALQDDSPGLYSSWKDLWWMDAGAVLGGLGLSLLDGGASLSAVIVFPFLVRGIYLVQKWLHEMSHLGAAAIFYPSHSSEIFTQNNLAGNLSKNKWRDQIMPLSSAQRSYVSLPFATAEDGWWKNQFVAKAGLIGSTTLALAIGYLIGLTPLLAPVIFGYLAVLKGSVQSGDLLGSDDTCNGTFGCGIIGFVKRVPSQGIKKIAIRSELTWFFESMDSLTVRGGQQAGVEINLLNSWKAFGKIIMKITKQKRNWLFWQTWDNGPVFYRNMIDDLHANLYNALPQRLVPIYNYAKFGVLKVLGHVRFATNGNLVQNAAHPHSSPEEKREQWVYDNVKKMFRKVSRVFQVTSAFNGDHDASKVGIPERVRLFGSTLEFAQMRSFFSAVVHKYYEGRVSKTYLKRTVSNGKEYKQTVETNYAAVLEALRKKGYVNSLGYVNRRFIKLDDEFKSWFPHYKAQVFNEIESALFGIPPGDAPIIPLEQHLNTTQGNWLASVRYAHVMVNHQDLEEATSDILSEQEEAAVGRVFSQVFDQVSSDLLRRGYTPDGHETTRSLNDLYVNDVETAKSLGLEDQYRMIEIFKGMLAQRMKLEVQQDSLAGEVFRQWEQKWKKQGLDAALMRRMVINAAVKKFFTADNLAATKEFAERADGSHGLFMSNTLEDGITLYQDNQDVVIGFNENTGSYAFASDPRILKTIGPKGEKVDQVMYLKDGEVVNMSFSLSGELIIRSWMRVNGKWTETSKEDLEKRFSPNEEYVDGKKNPYYAGPPVAYDNPRRVVQEDFHNIARILAGARAELDDPDSFNRQSTDYLAERIRDTINKKGSARLRFIGYDNSFSLSEQFKKAMKDLIDTNKLVIDVIDPNDFNDSPSTYEIAPDDIIMFISKSGATFSTKLSLRLIQKLVYQKNIFCMTARIDSVLNVMMGQGLRPEDKFIKRIFITGDFYPAETPVVSDVLLEFQLQQLAVNLALALGRNNGPHNSMGLKIPADRLKLIAPEIADEAIRKAQELTGFSIDGKAYANTDKEKKAIGTYLGKVALETWMVNRFMDLLVAGILSPNVLLLGYFGLLTQNISGLLYSGLGLLVNVILINYVYRFGVTEIYRKLINRPAHGRIAPFDLFIAAPPGIFDTQRNFFSRVMTNRLKSIGPAAIYGGDPKKNFVADSASDQKRGDINLRFALKHRANEGKMGVGQATYPQTAIFGTDFIKGRPEKIDVVVEVVHRPDASRNEISLIDNTVGFLGLMIAAKTIGVEMAKIASFDSRLFDLAFTFSKAGVHTTQINPIAEEARAILNSAGVKNSSDPAMSTTIETSQPAKAIAPGGIDMNSRLMRLKVTGEGNARFDFGDQVMSGPLINGVVPQVSGIVTVTPGMLKAMLGE